MNEPREGIPPPPPPPRSSSFHRRSFSMEVHTATTISPPKSQDKPPQHRSKKSRDSRTSGDFETVEEDRQMSFDFNRMQISDGQATVQSQRDSIPAGRPPIGFQQHTSVAPHVKSRLHRRTSSLEAAQFPTHGAAHPYQNYQNYVRPVQNMYSLPEEGPHVYHHAASMHVYPQPYQLGRGNSLTGIQPPPPPPQFNNQMRVQTSLYPPYSHAGPSPTLTYVTSPVAAIQPPAMHLMAQMSPRWVPSSPQGQAAGTPPGWYPPHMTLAVSSPPQPPPPPPPTFNYTPRERDEPLPVSDSNSSWASLAPPTSSTVSESPAVRFKISAYLGGHFSAGRVQRGSYTGGECRLVEVTNLQFQTIHTLRALLFKGRSDPHSASEPLVLRYYHPLLGKLVALYTDEDVTTMFEEWKQWREDAALFREPLHLYVSKDSAAPSGARISSRASSPVPSDRYASPRENSASSNPRQSGGSTLVSPVRASSPVPVQPRTARQIETAASLPIGFVPPPIPSPQFGFNPSQPPTPVSLQRSSTQLMGTSPSILNAVQPRHHRRNSSVSSIAPINVPVEIIDPADIIREKPLGEGSFGTVWRGTYQNHQVAIKTFYRGGLTAASADAIEEARTLSTLRHPNIVLSYGIVLPPPEDELLGEPSVNRSGEDALGRFVGPALVTEYMEGGSLHDLLRRNHQLGRKILVKLTLDAASGMKYLHSRSIIHFDLKSANLLLAWETVRDPLRSSISKKFAEGDANAAGTPEDRPPPKPRRVLNCKVADFGLSKFIEGSKQHISLGASGSPLGTISWTAPEVYDVSARRPRDSVDLNAAGGHSRQRSDASGIVFARESSGVQTGDSSSVVSASGTAITHAHVKQSSMPSAGAGRRVSDKVDVYSFGIVMWETWTRKEPYSHIENRNEMTIMFYVASGGRPVLPETADWDEFYGSPAPPEPMPGWSELMQECWQRDPLDRPSFDEICRRLRAGLEQMDDDE